jgi:hypothetical protein
MLQAKLLAEQLLAELRELRVEVRLLRQAIGREKTTTGGE